MIKHKFKYGENVDLSPCASTPKIRIYVAETPNGHLVVNKDLNDKFRVSKTDFMVELVETVRRVDRFTSKEFYKHEKCLAMVTVHDTDTDKITFEIYECSDDELTKYAPKLEEINQDNPNLVVSIRFNEKAESRYYELITPKRFL